MLGPFWLVLGTLFGVTGIGLIWGALLGAERSNFVPSLTVGLVIWSLISGCITESTGAFFRSAQIIKNIRTPSLRISLQLVFRHIIIFAHNALIIVLVTILYPENLSPVALLAIPGLLLVFINLLAVVQVFGFVGARYRDLEPLVTALMPILFFMSPVIYRAHQLGAAELIITLNPIGYLIDVVRDPLLGVAPPWHVWAVTIVMTIVSWWVALWITNSKAQRLAYWV